MGPQLAAATEVLGWQQVLVYLRLQAFLGVLPVLGERLIPVRVRVSLALALTPLLAEPLARLPWPDNASAIAVPAVTEIAIGLVVGMMLRVLASSLAVAASTIASAMSLTQMLGIQPDASPHPVGNLLHLAGLAFLLALGFPIMLVRLVQDSLSLWPPSTGLAIAEVLPHLVGLVGRGFALALMLAAPFTLGSLLLNSLAAVIARVMPALPISFIIAPLVLLLALLGLALVAPVAVARWSEEMLDLMLPG